jgi:hypothetical protein
MAGASYMSEEWGTSNTFYDWQSYYITPYGKVKKDFLSFVSKNKDLGAIYTPFALVLPDELEMFDLKYFSNWHSHYLARESTDEESKIYEHVKKVFKLIFGESRSVYGNEGHVMTNSAFGDHFDIIYQSSKTAYQNYDYLIDLSYNSSLKQNCDSSKIIETADIEVFERELTDILKKELPCIVEGGIHWLLNKKKDKWIISLFNNEGVNRNSEKGDEFLTEGNVTVKIIFKETPNINLIFGENSGVRKLEDNIYICDIQSGDFAIYEF